MEIILSIKCFEILCGGTPCPTVVSWEERLVGRLAIHKEIVSAVLLLLRSLPSFTASEAILRRRVVGAMDPKTLRMRKEDESLGCVVSPKAWRNEA
jgi:hypothetical protein